MRFDSSVINLHFSNARSEHITKFLNLRNIKDREYLITILKNKYCEYYGRNYIIQKKCNWLL